MPDQAIETGAAATTVTAIPAKGPPPAPGAARAAKLASVSAGLAKAIAAETNTTSVDEPAKAESPAKAAEPQVEAKTEPKPAADADDKPDAKAEPEAKPSAEDDLQTKRGLAAVDRAKKQLLEEKARAKAELEQERADLLRDRSEFRKTATKEDELRALAKRDPLEALRRLGYATDEDEAAWEHVGRSAFPLTKDGKKDPRTREAAERAIRERGSSTKLDAAMERIEKLENELKDRDTRSQAKDFARDWTDKAIKAIPTEPTLIGKLHAKSPDKARSAILDIGARLERELGAAPTHAEAIAEYERVRRDELEEQGVDVDAMLVPTSATATKAAPSKTLDVAQPATGTKPINGATTRTEKLSAASKGLQKLWASGEQP